MTNIDDDRLELLERQLAERITERVRSALFKVYALVGVAVISVLGFVSWDIISDIKSEIKLEIKSEITEEIDEEIKAKRGEIIEQVSETRFMAKRANEVIQRIQKQLDDFQPQADNFDETIEKVKTLKVTSQNLIASYSQELEPLIANVKSLSKQLKVLAEQVDQLNAIASTGGFSSEDTPTQTAQKRTEQIKYVISEAKEAEQRLKVARKKTTVFFQFARGRREQAEALSAVLKAKGYIVPGEDRESGAAGRHEIRYFHDKDESAAKDLAEDTTSALLSLGYTDRTSPNVEAKSLVSYRGKKPRLGVLELWLEIPQK